MVLKLMIFSIINNKKQHRILESKLASIAADFYSFSS